MKHHHMSKNINSYDNLNPINKNNLIKKYNVSYMCYLFNHSSPDGLICIELGLLEHLIGVSSLSSLSKLSCLWPTEDTFVVFWDIIPKFLLGCSELNYCLSFLNFGVWHWLVSLLSLSIIRNFDWSKLTSSDASSKLNTSSCIYSLMTYSSPIF